MFGLFKKREPKPVTPPAMPKSQYFQKFFATTWVQTALTTSVAGFSGAVLCGDGNKVVANAWKKMWESNCPNDPMMQPDGLAVDHFFEGGYLIVFITFPPPQIIGGAYFGAAVIGPCDDPRWGPDARRNLPFRYFVLLAAEGGTSIEEWTVDPPTALGVGPEPESFLFVQRVLNQAVRSSADITVAVRKADKDVESAIARARHELPRVLDRFIAGDLLDANFTVKVRIEAGGFTEHFWLSDTSYADGRFTGIIDATPQSESPIKRGDLWTASVEEVTDWMYARNQKMYGNYTLRALLHTMPPHEAAKYRAVLADEEG